MLVGAGASPGPGDRLTAARRPVPVPLTNRLVRAALSAPRRVRLRAPVRGRSRCSLLQSARSALVSPAGGPSRRGDACGARSRRSASVSATILDTARVTGDLFIVSSIEPSTRAPQPPRTFFYVTSPPPHMPHSRAKTLHAVGFATQGPLVAVSFAQYPCPWFASFPASVRPDERAPLRSACSSAFCRYKGTCRVQASTMRASRAPPERFSPGVVAPRRRRSPYRRRRP